MARQKKSRKLTDIMPTRKADKRPDLTPKSGKKLTRYELDAKAREEKRKRKHKGLDSGSRHSALTNPVSGQTKVEKDPRIGSRKKVPLMVEEINRPEKGLPIKPVAVEAKQPHLDPAQELAQLENNECLNELLDQLEVGKTLNAEDQKFVDQCLDRIEELMALLGLTDEEDEEDDLLRTFERIDINQFK